VPPLERLTKHLHGALRRGTFQVNHLLSYRKAQNKFSPVLGYTIHEHSFASR
jgi:hypothetical protein